MLIPSIASAHVAVQTFELVAGAVHPWIYPDSALVLGGLSLWLAQRANSTEFGPYVVNGLALTAGVAVGINLSAMAPNRLADLTALAVGLCVAVQWNPPSSISVISAVAFAFLGGYSAGVDAAPDVRSQLAFLTGALAGGLVFPLAVAAASLEGRSQVARVGLRILGSWLAALGLMLLVLHWRG